LSFLKSAMWIHGNIVQVQIPERVNEGRFDWGTSYTRRKDAQGENWFHFPIPTPVIVDDQRPLLAKVFVFYETRSSRITEVRVRDGTTDVKRFENLTLAGDHRSSVDSSNSWDIDPPTTIFFGLGISVHADIGSIPHRRGAPEEVIFTTAGADFRSP
jgi:hypothetical protein